MDSIINQLHLSCDNMTTELLPLKNPKEDKEKEKEKQGATACLADTEETGVDVHMIMCGWHFYIK